MKKIQQILLLLLLSYLFSIGQSIEIVDGWFVIDGEKFFVKGIGYETNARPGQVPWNYLFEPEIIQSDLERIKTAGFNTIRTWGALSEEQLLLVETSGLKIIFGIWIDPEGDFSDPSFRSSAISHVNEVLDYTKDFSCVIAYLIMNEPMVDHIKEEGAGVTLSLWDEIIAAINEKHPGISAGVSLAILHDFVRTDHFGFASYNAYMYNPSTISDSHRYSEFLRYLKQNRAANLPLIVTEFGLSVSPTTSDRIYGYGGNNLTEQTEGDLLMYKNAIKAGVQGTCIFQYHDGWWKAGNEFVHDDHPEEWFGLHHFDDGNNSGDSRPVWDSVTVFNNAIVTLPQDGEIYGQRLPIEFFPSNKVTWFSLLGDDSIFIDSMIVDFKHFSDEIEIHLSDTLTDYQLSFKFFDENSILLKSEIITVLLNPVNLPIPEIEMRFSREDIIPGINHIFTVEIQESDYFTITDNKIDLSFHPHISWDYGETRNIDIAFSSGQWNHSESFYIPINTPVVTYGAGYTINHGRFSKRVAAEKIFLVGDWANELAGSDIVTNLEISESRIIQTLILEQNYPNPFNGRSIIRFYLPKQNKIEIKIFNVKGRLIKTLIKDNFAAGSHSVEIDMKDASSGVYFYRLTTGNFQQTKKLVYLK